MSQKPCEMLLQQLHGWLHRKTTSSALRRVATLPIAIATDIGLVREENQDRIAVMKFYSFPLERNIVVIALADGMGGMIGGANAASLTISSFFTSIIKNTSKNIQICIDQSIKKANDDVFDLYSGNGGATLSAIIDYGSDNILAVNVGDSRIYELNNSRITQLTEDDTLAAIAQKYYDGNQVKDVDLTRFHNELVQFMGQESELEPHYIDILKESKKKIVLTSDGAHSIGEDSLLRLFSNATNSGIFIRRAIDVANWFGGRDNSSIAVYDVYDSITPQDSNLGNGVINIWDCYGELQIVNVQIEEISSVDNNISLENVPTVNKDDEVKSTVATEETAKSKPKKATRIYKRTKKSNPDNGHENKEDKEKNQLDIYFDGKKEGGS